MPFNPKLETNCEPGTAILFSNEEPKFQAFKVQPMNAVFIKSQNLQLRGGLQPKHLFFGDFAFESIHNRSDERAELSLNNRHYISPL